jgi:hypothetical protein
MNCPSCGEGDVTEGSTCPHCGNYVPKEQASRAREADGDSGRAGTSTGTNGPGIVSLVFGALAAAALLVNWPLGAGLGLLSVIFGHVSRREGVVGAVSSAGLILGYIGVVAGAAGTLSATRAQCEEGGVRCSWSVCCAPGYPHYVTGRRST